jgi:hypothetical protein
MKNMHRVSQVVSELIRSLAAAQSAARRIAANIAKLPELLPRTKTRPNSTQPTLTLYRSGITRVVLQALFKQQNQRVKSGRASGCAAPPSYSLICIGSRHRGHASPSPAMTTNFLRLRLGLNAPP